MSTSQTRPSYLSWFLKVPAAIPGAWVRYYVYWKTFYALALAYHAFALFMFWGIGAPFMAYFNVGSVIVFTAALVLLKSGHMQLAYWAAICELTLHGIAATISIGFDAGFANYPFLVVILLFIQPFYSWRTATVASAAVLLSAVTVTGYAHHAAPIYTVDARHIEWLAMIAIAVWPVFVMIMVLPFISAASRAEAEVAEAFTESERLLLNILPAPIAKRLKATSGMIADEHEEVVVLFLDIVDFTRNSARLPPTELVAFLNRVFHAMDTLVARYRVEKIKTIGDAYMVVVGLPDPVSDPKVIAARLALDMREAAGEFEWPGTGEPLSVRIGINAGRVVAGVIGERKFAYDLWGDTVNIAARLEAASGAGQIQVTQAFAASLEGLFEFDPRGTVTLKGLGETQTCFLMGPADC